MEGKPSFDKGFLAIDNVNSRRQGELYFIFLQNLLFYVFILYIFYNFVCFIKYKLLNLQME